MSPSSAFPTTAFASSRRRSRVSGWLSFLPQMDSIRFGSRVIIRWADGRTQVVRLVGPDEADAKKGEVSVESPLAAALLGSSQGDHVELVRPAGTLDGEIVSVD